MVGLSTAYQLKKRNISNNILIIEKEYKFGCHSSGRNRGVIHAGLYYEPNSLKANVCVKGGRRLIKWAEEKGITINRCGKIIVPQRESLNSQLDLLAKRGRANGAKVEIWDEKQLYDFAPYARSSTGRSLWSPNTCVVNPREIMENLTNELSNLNIKFLFNQKNISYKKNSIITQDGNEIFFDNLINCAGLESVNIAHQYNVGKDYRIIPFKGLYWDIKDNFLLKIRTNIYPVPDLNVPFLGVHFTPSSDNNSVYIGPTAIPALGRYNYKGFENFETVLTIKNLFTFSKLYISNKERFRNYVNEQAFMRLPFLLINSAKQIIPSINLKNIRLSNKVGIRAQLYNEKTSKLENDFLCLKQENSIHVLNAISPAFTASFELADLIINRIIN